MKRFLTIFFMTVLCVAILCTTAFALTEKENNDTAGTAQSLTLGETIEGEITEKDIDYYRFTLKVSGKVTLDITSYMPYYCIYLYDADGECLWYTDENEYNSTVGFRNDVYVIYLEAGTYFMQVNGFRNANKYTWSWGEYTLHTTFQSANATEKEGNNSHATANKLNLNGSVIGLIGINDRYDFFKVTMPESGCLTLDITSYMHYYCLDVYDAYGDLLWYTEENEYNSTVGFLNDKYNLYLEAGTYTIQVNGYRNSNKYTASTGTYTLKNVFYPANATETEDNDTYTTANELPLNSSASGLIGLNDRYDFYRLNVPVTGTVELNITSYMKYYCVQIYDEDGKLWVYSDENIWNETVMSREDTYHLDMDAGVYVIRIDGYRNSNEYSSSTGTYELYVEHFHDFGSWKTVKEPTYSAEGLRERLCACGKVETQTIPMLQLFNDVANNAWYRDAVLWAVQEGVTSGVSSTMFAPERTCTRAQVVTFLWRAAGEPTPKSTANPFTDVSSKDYYYKAVLWAVEKGITTGMTKTTFAPDKGCTRGQVVTFLYRFAKTPGVSGSNAFKDVLPGAYYYEAVLWAVKNNITTGVNNTSFAPDRYCTRAQIVTFLYRYLG